MSVGATCTSASPIIRLRRGRRNSSARRSPGTTRRAILFAIATPRSMRGPRRRRRWTFTKFTAARSPWQNAYVERLIGSLRCECLDHVIIWNQRGLRRVLTAYVAYYSSSRTHLSLNKDAPISRQVAFPADGAIVAIPQVGGLHHRYERRVA